MSIIEKHTLLVKQKAEHFGFDFCGIAEAAYLEQEAPRLEAWLQQGMHGQMGYMARNFEKRLDPRKLVPGARSVVTLLYNYYPKKDLATKHQYKIAKYAYGEDYHFVIKRKLKDLLQAIQLEVGAVEGRVFVDSAPVMERTWAQKGGLGWIGKNSLLLNREMGSYFFIAELIIDLPLLSDPPIKDYCGSCTRCIDACPTEAITPYEVDASKCISYFTIELRDAIPEEQKGKFDNWIFGCDICQDVCPWNRFARPHNESNFDPSPDLENMRELDWLELTEEVFAKVFRKSAVKRTKFAGLKRNIRFLGLKNKKPR